MRKITIIFACFLVILGSIGLTNRNDRASAEQAAIKYEIVDVTASEHDGNVPENTIDDDLGTRWSAQGEGQWLIVDLGKVAEVGYVGLAFHSGDIRQTFFDLELSADGVTWNRVLENQASSGASVNLEAFDFQDQPARYVKFIGLGNSRNDWNSLTAVHVYAPNPAGPIVEELEAVHPGPKPEAEPFIEPGLVYPDGTKYKPHTPNKVIGKTLNVLDYGANPKDEEHDDLPAILAAIEEAEPGDEVYFPKGVYQLRSTMPNDRTSHIYLKDGVNLRGQSEKHVKLVSHFDVQNVPSSKIITGYGKHDVVISNMTLTSTFDRTYSDDPGQNNSERGGPAYGIFLADYASKPSYHITVDHVTVEKFQRMGVRIEKSNRIIVQNSTFQYATDVGGGGAGYGVAIQGVQGIHRLGHANDTYFNIVRDSKFIGPYIRHGTLIQNFAHNNLVDGNTYDGNIHDAIDLHGQGEYLNEIRNNTVKNIPRGGIGVGNTGGTPPNSHSASGAGNYIHHNNLTNTRDGITVLMGSPDTRIEDNVIMHTTEPAVARGIYLLNAPRTIVKGNKIMNNRGAGFWGILIAEDFGDRNNGGKGAGIPEDIVVENNKVMNNTNGMRIEAGKRIIIENNKIKNSREVDFISLINDEDDGEDEELLTVSLDPSKDALVDIERPDSNYGIADQALIDAAAPDQNFHKYFNVKRNADGSKGRLAYMQFDLQDYDHIKNAKLQLTAKTGSNTDVVTLAVFGIMDHQWDEETITWSNSPNHELDKVNVTGIGETAFLLGTIEINSSDPVTINLDVSEFVQQHNGKVSFLIADQEGQNGNVTIYSKEDSSSGRWPLLVVEKAK
ncbi:DNRLRE domain-containing protein [Bacillus sp. FJAT-50079]|uniref:DNRLRE domain-containing protein n=1 Tax=Bacillus sp. FJAT-50079 TaxID=2833577 RepID=UPI001BC92D58|nr:DNRLRE domain-containing protein [Bacillus sp. FJAT-50079]MBS4208863.1 DNRLRE domain-containing protein [Bacillus sp. FJAT-50079]